MRQLQLPAYLILLMIGFFLSINSCSYKHYKGFTKVIATEISLPVIFDPTFKKANYLTHLEVFGNQLSGITIIKKAEQTNTFHVVFMSQIGIKYFDLEIAMDEEAEGFKMNYIMESLNRDFIVDALKADFELLFAKFNNDAQLQIYQHPQKEIKEIIISDGKNLASYIIDKKNVQSISLKKGSSDHASIIIKEFNTIYPRKFEMTNKKARLKMIMSEIILE
jgi:hypothetical protein